ncbi:GTPase HflX [Streptomyces agglomeratus]|uniref:GTPase HflX n=1 Tax=Streptomyces agglomeratus TaxID=285458 RepID=A0A1E5P516_9ACTN|nr:GTPase HflX [Streptomyces agglomeratus]OEJ24658.1 GTPase HflX [Streptomyces agglomeratus]OEJ41372.1 GTPase HflX [Streptomyces agglomeratus]OEJ44251.1 GTPase HflX [Streptomyces agglomeratus]OEJ53876.1 GTPase HflX [Streptomyces agglomeratus]OEJ61241.1 GTPase HflX [Streptomyces agglomeratus]
MTSSSSASNDAQSFTENVTESLRADALMEEDVAWSYEVDGERDGDQFDRSDRAALRRVAGLSTELEDVTEVEYRQLRLERVVLVGVWTSGTVLDAENSLAELAALAETAGALVLDGVVQRRDKPDPATYIGSGKAIELRDIVIETGADTVVCDGELSPGQLIHLEDVVKVKVVDRTALILDIFAQHAKSREGKAQVALAQMQYMLPRLRGWGQSLSRQMGGAGSGGGGGMATRGPGETKIETDRRRIREKMAKMRREIAEMKTGRDIKRQERKRNKVPSVAIAGYTNAGKSSLLNRLTGAGVLVENALFATLDPTVRRAETPTGRVYTLADTVGFVRHLPHHLVEAFRSTMEEVGDSDLILHVVDGSHPAPEEQLAAVREVIRDVGALNVPEIVVINKADAADPVVLQRLLRIERHAIAVSARTGAGMAELLALIDSELPRPEVEIEALVPYTHGGLISRAHAEGEVISEEHTGDGTLIKVRVHEELAADLAPYVPAATR